jgi:hypothetical protein
MHIVESSEYPNTRDRVFRRLLGERIPPETADQMLHCLDSDEFETRAYAANKLFGRALDKIRHESIRSTRTLVFSKPTDLHEWLKDKLLSEQATKWQEESLACARIWFAELFRLVTENGKSLGTVGRIEWAAVTTERVFRGTLALDDPILNKCNDWVRRVAQYDPLHDSDPLNDSEAKWWHRPCPHLRSANAGNFAFFQFGCVAFCFDMAIRYCISELKDEAILREPIATTSWQPPPKNSLFDHCPDYTWVFFRGRRYSLTPQQSLIIQLLDTRRIEGHLFTPRELIQRRIGASNSDPRDSFKNHKANKQLWGTLIVVKNRQYSLMLD